MRIRILFLALIVLVSACGDREAGADIVLLKKGWKIKKGDDLAWAEPMLDDASWQSIDPQQGWEVQNLNFRDYDGYTWYRIAFTLPEALLENSYFGKELQINLGKIDDSEQTFLNGKLIGQNNQFIVDPDARPGKFEEDSMASSCYRNYKVPVTDPRIQWGQRNIIAIRVHNLGGKGGMNNPEPSVSMVDIKDYLVMDVISDPFEIEGEHYFKKIRLMNRHPAEDFNGKISVTVTSRKEDKIIYKSTDPLTVWANSQAEHMFSFKAASTESYTIEYNYKIDEAFYPLYASQLAPYILTPHAPEEPRINGPTVIGAGPGHPVFYTIPASGIRPMTFAVEGLPEGLRLDSLSGQIRGIVRKKGSYPLSLIAENSMGIDQKEVSLKVGDTIQLTPPMGWKSGHCQGLNVSDAKIRESAEAMQSSGLINYAWTFITIDDGWQAEERTSRGILTANDKFPDMAGLSEHVHKLGLKTGIYSSPGPISCRGYLGSYRYEIQDARTWAEWGIDYLMYDWCTSGEQEPDESIIEEVKAPFKLMRAALNRVDRDIVYGLRKDGMGNISEWGADVGGNFWQTGYDTEDTWERIKSTGFSQEQYSEFAYPGGFNDPGMLFLGYFDCGSYLHPSRLTPDEQYSQVSLWCLLSAPLFIGNDLSIMDDFTRSLLTNPEVLEVNQDALCDQAEKVYVKDSIEVWMKRMADGSLAAGIFNMDEVMKEVSIPMPELGLDGRYLLRDLWRQEDITEEKEEINVEVYGHGVVLLRMREV